MISCSTSSNNCLLFAAVNYVTVRGLEVQFFLTLNASFLSVLPTVEMLRMMTCCSPIFCRPCCLVWRETQRTRWCPDRSTALWYEGSWARSIGTRIRIWNCSGSSLFCNNSEIRKQRITLWGKPKLSKPFFLDFFRSMCYSWSLFANPSISGRTARMYRSLSLCSLTPTISLAMRQTVKLWATEYPHGQSFTFYMWRQSTYFQRLTLRLRCKFVNHSPTACLR